MDSPTSGSLLVRTSEIAWRFLVVAAAIALIGWVVVWLKLIVVPMLLGIFAAAVFAPPTYWLRSRGWHPLLATWTVLVAVGILVTGLGFAIAPGVSTDVAELSDSISDAVVRIESLLAAEPFNLSEGDIEGHFETLMEELRANASRVISGALGGATLVIELVAGAALALVATFFFAKDGDRMVQTALSWVPEESRPWADAAAHRAWKTVGGYLRGVVVVGLVDAIAVGIGLIILGVPLVVPLMLLIFFGAFFPLIGAFIGGLVAALVALAAEGLVTALIVVAIVVAVQRIEGDVIAPIVFSRAVALHPLLVLVALAGGAVVGGIIGAFFAVPFVAVAVAVSSPQRLATLEEEARSDESPDSGLSGGGGDG